jgi:hypothetical protein
MNGNEFKWFRRNNMEIGEAVKVGVAAIEKNSPSCSHQEKKEEEYGWHARVNKDLGSDTTKCSGKNLYDSMKPREKEHENEKNLGCVPDKESREHWKTKGLAAVDKRNFPVQAHHLIPKNFLPTQDVCVWLCQKWNKDNEYQLVEDSFYNTDHANNGYAMPYAYPLKEWKEAATGENKCHVAFRVMELTGVQLHQGSHAKILDQEKVNKLVTDENKLPISVTPVDGSSDTDEYEDGEIHSPGYTDYIGKLLLAVGSQVKDHVKDCQYCQKGKEGNKTLVQPLADSVRLMDQVSYIVKVSLTLNLIYVCPYGEAYAVENSLLSWDSNKKRYKVKVQSGDKKKNLTKGALKKEIGEFKFK